MKTKLSLFTSLSLTLSLGLVTGCPEDEDETGDDGAATEAGTGADDGVATMTTAAMTADDGADADASGTGMVDDGDDDGSGSVGDDVMDDGGSGDDDGGEPLPDGSQCTEDAECMSMNCFVAGPLGGICGECNEDADCEGGGCSIPNPITMAPSQCNDGSIGGGCMSSDVCMDPLVCALILEVPGIISASTCSECEDDAGCTDKAAPHCSPVYDVANISGQKECVEPGSVPDGGGCDLAGTGDDACMSGACAEANFMMLVSLGVCSECDDAKDCKSGVCNPPTIDLATGLVPGACGE